MQFSIKNQLVLLPPLSLVCTLYIENREPTRGSERYRDYEGFRFVEKQRADLHGKSLISLVITVRHRMEYVFMIILYRMIISSASPHNRIVDRLYHTVWRSEELCSVLAVLRLQSTSFFTGSEYFILNYNLPVVCARLQGICPDVSRTSASYFGQGFSLLSEAVYL